MSESTAIFDAYSAESIGRDVHAALGCGMPPHVLTLERLPAKDGLDQLHQNTIQPFLLRKDVSQVAAVGVPVTRLQIMAGALTSASLLVSQSPIELWKWSKYPPEVVAWVAERLIWNGILRDVAVNVRWPEDETGMSSTLDMMVGGGMLRRSVDKNGVDRYCWDDGNAEAPTRETFLSHGKGRMPHQETTMYTLIAEAVTALEIDWVDASMLIHHAWLGRSVPARRTYYSAPRLKALCLKKKSMRDIHPWIWDSWRETWKAWLKWKGEIASLRFNNRSRHPTAVPA